GGKPAGSLGDAISGAMSTALPDTGLEAEVPSGGATRAEPVADALSVADAGLPLPAPNIITEPAIPRTAANEPLPPACGWKPVSCCATWKGPWPEAGLRKTAGDSEPATPVAFTAGVGPRPVRRS